ncbi:hypothetical protein ACJMK2_020725 [Sinanodonta woodiana]|uniref:NR LBD domain-containing protein n=1 Tax=Sinanodonta woodiana TaxID=1069815 RepID=A0ABD3U2W4_SINWO
MYHNDRWQSHSQEMNTLTTLSLDSVIIDDEIDSTPTEIHPALQNHSCASEQNVQKNIHGDNANRDSVTKLKDNTQSNSLTSPQQSSQEHAKEKTFGYESHKVNIQESTDENRCSSDVPYQTTVDSESGIFSSGNKVLEESSSCSGMPRSPILPPCRICHEKASGIHYGLNTCEACKERYRKFCESMGITSLSENPLTFSVEKRQVMLEKYIKYMENGVKGFVAFCKQLPDFNKFHIDDKAALIKNSVFDAWQIGVHKCIDPEKTVVSGMHSMHKDELRILWGQDFIDEFFNNLECLKKLDLTRQEMGILRGICLSFSDRVELQNRTMVEELHWKFIECLRYLTLQRFPNFGPRFSQIISCLVKMRGLNEQFLKASENMKMVWPFIQNSPIAYEVFFSE